jgi:transposase
MVLKVRPITNEEGNALRRVVRHGKDPIELRRAMVILSSAQGFRVPKISVIALMSEDYCRTLIHQFNRDGLAMLKPRWNPGHRTRYPQETRDRLVALATSRPRDLGLPFAQWSLRRLRDQAIRQGIVEKISAEWLRVILDEADITYQSIRTWKESKDPKLEEKRQRIDRLTHQKHNPPVVLSADEIGPISLKPQEGKGWFRAKRPGRVSATYHKSAGTRYEYLCLNVYHQQIFLRQEERKGGRVWLRFLKYQRAKYPEDQRVYIIQDGLSAHWTPEVRQWAAAHKVTLVPTATNASWMNPCETHAKFLQDTVLAGSEFHDWEEVRDEMRRGAALINRERKASGKVFRDTRDGRRKHRRPLWMRH